MSPLRLPRGARLGSGPRLPRGPRLGGGPRLPMGLRLPVGTIGRGPRLPRSWDERAAIGARLLLLMVLLVATVAAWTWLSRPRAPEPVLPVMPGLLPTVTVPVERDPGPEGPARSAERDTAPSRSDDDDASSDRDRTTRRRRSEGSSSDGRRDVTPTRPARRRPMTFRSYIDRHVHLLSWVVLWQQQWWPPALAALLAVVVRSMRRLRRGVARSALLLDLAVATIVVALAWPAAVHIPSSTDVPARFHDLREDVRPLENGDRKIVTTREERHPHRPIEITAHWALLAAAASLLAARRLAGLRRLQRVGSTAAQSHRATPASGAPSP